MPADSEMWEFLSEEAADQYQAETRDEKRKASENRVGSTNRLSAWQYLEGKLKTIYLVMLMVFEQRSKRAKTTNFSIIVLWATGSIESCGKHP